VLIGFLVVANAASTLVTRLAHRSPNAERTRAQVAILSRATDALATSYDDVRPLLNAIRTAFPFVDLLVRRCRHSRRDADDRQDLAIAYRRLAIAARLTSSALTLERPTVAPRGADDMTVPVVRSDVIDLMLVTGTIGDGTLVVDVTPALPQILVDRDLAKRSLGLVLRHALRFTTGPTPVHVSAGSTLSKVDVMIADQGPRATPTRRGAFTRDSADPDEGPGGLPHSRSRDEPAEPPGDGNPGRHALHGITTTVRVTRTRA
jgi:signal transduction histidine kinase